jgi:hypothetical protein
MVRAKLSLGCAGSNGSNTFVVVVHEVVMWDADVCVKEEYHHFSCWYIGECHYCILHSVAVVAVKHIDDLFFDGAL